MINMDKILCYYNKTNRWLRVTFIFLLVELRLIPKQQLGFECNDPSLSYPYTGDTISWKWLLATVILLPLCVMLVIERYIIWKTSEGSKQAICWYKEYLFGVLVNITIVQSLKALVGAPRPHFFESCNPHEARMCTGTDYVYSYSCLKSQWIAQSDTSFPSGHTSLAVHTGVFIAYYLYRRIEHQSKAILAMQVLSVGSAVFCAVSRITDRRHHLRDVLAGSVIAVPILVYTVRSLCKNFDHPEPIVKKSTGSECETE